MAYKNECAGISTYFTDRFANILSFSILRRNGHYFKNLTRQKSHLAKNLTRQKSFFLFIICLIWDFWRDEIFEGFYFKNLISSKISLVKNLISSKISDLLNWDFWRVRFLTRWLAEYSFEKKGDIREYSIFRLLGIVLEDGI